MRVCHVIAGLAATDGGPTNVVLGLTKYLARLGVGVEIVTVGRSTAEGREARDKSRLPGEVEIVFCRSAFGSRFAYSPELNRMVRERVCQADLVHVHGLWSYPTNVACAAARSAGVPYVITAHGALSAWALRRRRWRKSLLLRLREARNIREAAAIHLFTPEEELDARIRGLARNVMVVANGIDPEALEPRPPRGEFRAAHGLGETPVVMFLGRIHPVKHLELLVEAFRQTVELRPDACLVIAGPESRRYGRRIRRLVVRHRLASRVIFTGMLSGAEKCALIRDADVFALPSHQEAQSVAMIEALYYGVPIVTTRSCNGHETSSAGAGVSVEADPREMGTAIAELLARAARRQAMGEIGEALVARRYTWATVAAEMLRAYEAIVGEGRPQLGAATAAGERESQSRQLLV